MPFETQLGHWIACPEHRAGRGHCLTKHRALAAGSAKLQVHPCLQQPAALPRVLSSAARLLHAACRLASLRTRRCSINSHATETEKHSEVLGGGALDHNAAAHLKVPESQCSWRQHSKQRFQAIPALTQNASEIGCCRSKKIRRNLAHRPKTVVTVFRAKLRLPAVAPSVATVSSQPREDFSGATAHQRARA